MKREELLGWLDSLIINSAELGESGDAKSWGYEEGILISRNEAEEIRTRLSLPPAEGAEEIIRKYCHTCFSRSTGQEEVWSSLESVIIAVHEFATLHAQRLAEKMVEERLREYGDTLRGIKSLFTENNGEIVISERDVFKAYDIVNNAICSIK